MMLPRCVFHIALTLFFSAQLTPSNAFAASPNHSPQVAGHIDNIDCTNLNGFELKRNGVAVRRESQLRDGDAIRITDPKCKVTINIAGSIRTLSTTDGSYDVKASGISLIDRIRYVMGYSGGNTGEGIGLGIGAGFSRADDDSEITIPLLDLWDNQIAAGTQVLHLAWRNGKGPFGVTVAMKGKGEAPLVRMNNIQSRAVRFESLTLQPGTYLVTVQGKTGQQTQATFDVVEPSQIPTPPSELRTTRSESDLLQAGWLASNGHGEYVFEAYQRISALGSKDTRISRIRERLEAGWRPRLE